MTLEGRLAKAQAEFEMKDSMRTQIMQETIKVGGIKETIKVGRIKVGRRNALFDADHAGDDKGRRKASG